MDIESLPAATSMYSTDMVRTSNWKGRYATVFDRMAAIGLPLVGPQYPNGRQADPWPDELPGG